jgi:glycosyltransferase involved in cell wall biosynthesis
MRVLIAHNAYRQRGGEDEVVEAEAALLTAHGHEVHRYQRHNDELAAQPGALVALAALWSRRTVRELDALLARLRPDIVHVHNFFPLISPSLYVTAARHGVPVVQTLHNFRLLCPQASLVRDGADCRDCVGRLPWRAVARRCYRGSAPQSAVLAALLTVHRAAGTFRHGVARYIALSRFCKDELARGGLPAERIAIKPNFVALPPPPSGPRAGALFVGRLADDKGVAVLAEAATLAQVTIDVIGDGPARALVERTPRLRALGTRPPAEVYAAMRSAACLVVPSLAAEAFPRVVVESFACGLPVLASDRGSLPELVAHGRTGLVHDAGDARVLAAQLAWAATHAPALRVLGESARAEYEARYTPALNLRRLVAIYDEARARPSWKEAA